MKSDEITINGTERRPYMMLLTILFLSIHVIDEKAGKMSHHAIMNGSTRTSAMNGKNLRKGTLENRI